MNTVQKTTDSSVQVESSLGHFLTVAATGLAGAAGLGLVGAMIAPAFPIVSILAAGAGLAAGLIATKFDKK